MVPGGGIEPPQGFWPLRILSPAFAQNLLEINTFLQASETSLTRISHTLDIEAARDFERKRLIVGQTAEIPT